nr:hypothetical protein [Sphingomonas profundi]
MFHAEQHAQLVGTDAVHHLACIDVRKQASDGDARIVDEAIDTPEPLLGGRDDRLPLGFIPDIVPLKYGMVAKFVGDAGAVRLAAATEYHLGTRGDEEAHLGFALTAGSARHDHDLVLQSFHHPSPLSRGNAA